MIFLKIVFTQLHRFRFIAVRSSIQVECVKMLSCSVVLLQL